MSQLYRGSRSISSLQVAVGVSEQRDLRLGILFSLVVVSVHLFNVAHNLCMVYARWTIY